MADEMILPKREVPNATTTAAIEEAHQAGVSSFDSVAELMADLKSEE